ncbi:MAG: hypothetical protein HZA77_08850 [Candidatus Schekmanbacteria bacterium]|nr:hypothetical protein [Candidatus Schekmanbacteria bacterium]
MNTGTKRILFSIILIYIFHILSVAGFYSHVNLKSGFPILNDDYTIHYAHVEPTKAFFRDSFSLWGYDPYFNSGEPRNTVFDADAKAAEIVCLIFSFASSALVYNIYVLSIYLLAPLIFLWSLYNFGLKGWGAVAGFLFGTCYWWSYPSFRFNLAGQFAFIFVSYLTLLILSLFYRYVRTGAYRYIMLCGLIGGIALCVHILAPINIAVGAVVIYGLSFKKMSLKQHLGLFSCLVFILLVNSPWIIPFIRFYKMNNLSSIGWFFGEKNPFLFIDAYLLGGGIHRYLRLAILFAAVGGFVVWKKEKSPLFYPLAINSIILFIYVFFGSYSSLTFLQNPWRYEFEMNLFLLIPASVYITSIFGNGIMMKQKIISSITCIFLLICLFPVNALHAMKILLPSHRNERIIKYDRLSLAGNNGVEYSFEELPHNDIPPAAFELIDWIKNNTTNEGRIMLEDSCWQSRHAYWGSHIPGMFPQLTGREFIGGPIPQYFMIHHYASFQEGFFCGKYLEKYNEEELMKKIDQYNIKWIICFTPYSRDYFSKFNDNIFLLDRVEKFYIYEVDRKPDFFISGKGNVKATYNHIKLSDLPEGNDVIIKYHWLETLKTFPPRSVEMAPVDDDPVGFIKIKNVPKEIEIFNAY